MKRKELYVAFIAVEEAHDKVCREDMWSSLRECVVDWYLIKSMSGLYGSRACVKLGSIMREYFEIRRGLRHGCVMSP